MATISADSACCLNDSMSQIRPRSDKPSAPLVDRDINKIVERKLSANNFRVLHWSLDPLGESNGFLGQYYTLSVTVKIDDKSESLRFFAKTPPPVHSPQYEFLLRFNTFNKEIIVYTEIFSRMGKGSGPKWIPDCYLGKNNAIIVLEDATMEGYSTSDKHVPFGEEQCVLVARALSMLHSRSLILDEKLRRSGGRTIADLYGHLLNEVLFDADDERSQKALSSCVKGASTLVDLVEGLKDAERPLIKERIGRWAKKVPALLGPSRKFRNVMCHRDVWANNLMFKRDATGKPIGCYLIDFQFLRYCPPSIDFTFSLYLTTDRATRDRCFDSLVRIYHDTMREQLAAEGFDVDECIPLEEFVKSCADARHLALTYGVVNLQVMLLSGDAIKDTLEGSSEDVEAVFYGDKRTDLVRHQFENVPAYKARLTEIICEIKDRLPDCPPNL